MDHARRFSWCGQRRRTHEAGWEWAVLMVIWLALNRCDACLPSELQALLDIRMQADDNDFFNSWDVNADCCRNWQGISCDNGTGAVSLLQLAAKGDDRLRFREFPAAVCNLTELRGIIITGARFTSGGFPPCLWNMTLKVLDMSHSYVESARIPSHGLKQLKVLRFRSVGVPHFNWKVLFQPNSSLEVLDLTNSGLTGSLDAAEFGGESRLRYLNLRSNRLEGRIPPSMGQLKSLYEMDLSGNLLNGSIPRELGNLTRLTILQLRNNQLSGKIPNRLSELTNLISLDLGKNTLKGQIPERFGNLSKLEELKLDSNKLNGELPASLGNLRNLVDLNVGYNKLEEIPELKDLTSLRFLDLKHNKFKGRIPDTVGRLSVVERLTLRSNRFSGPIPEFLGNLTTLSYLNLAHNQLSGTIPDALMNLRTQTLRLSFNELSCPVPLWFRNMTEIRSLNISHNGLWGSIPESFFSWNIELDLSNNHLTGTIHPFDNLLELYLSNNNLTGNIPPPSGNRSSIVRVIDFSFNLLTGSIFVLEKYDSLNRIILSSNQFSGGIPGFQTLSDLEILHLGSNQLNGSIPSSLNSSVKLQSLKLSTNQLTGPIPGSLGNLWNLRVLDLSGNRLSGVIPPSLGNLLELVQLKLQNNSLRGTIPAFCDEEGDHQLRSLSVGDNRLHGKIPPSFRKCKKLNVLVLANNRLTGRFRFTSTLRVLLVGSNNLGGTLPGTLSDAESLQILDISDNRFRGKIPRDLGKLKGYLWNKTRNSKVDTLYEEDISFVVKGIRLRFTYVLTMQTSINLSFNNFNDTIPPQFGLLHGLQHLNLSGNSLTGEIPKYLQTITVLESLDVSRNRLTGRIPEELQLLFSLQVVNFSDNFLVGPIPTGYQFATFTNESYINNAGLCGPPIGPCGQSENTNAASLQSPEFIQGFRLGFCAGFSFICVIGSAYFYFSSFQDLVSKFVDILCLQRVMDLVRCHCFPVSSSQVSDESAPIPGRFSCNSTRQDDEAHISRWAYGSASG